MPAHRLLPLVLLAGTAQQPLHGQEAEAPVPEESPTGSKAEPLDEEDDVEEIVVIGQRPPGSAIGDIAPEVTFNRGDIRSFGAGSIAELLEAIAPQTRSSRGRGGERPVVLLNGQRISGFSEIRGIPPEALIRVDVLPEEVALKYGYRPDQRVVNFVTRRRFSAVTAEADYGQATAGSRSIYEGEVSVLRIDEAGRWNVDAEYEHSDPLLESQRDIIQSDPDTLFDLGPFRTLLAASDQVSLNGTLNRALFEGVSTTFNVRLDASEGRSLFGLPAGFLADPSGAVPRPLTRDTSSRTGHLGIAMNGDIERWRWSFTGNYDRASITNLTDLDSLSDPRGRNRAFSVTDTANAELVVNGSPVRLPAGPLSTTIRFGAGRLGFRGETLREGLEEARELSRSRANAQLSVDLPIASRRSDVLGAIGDLSLNANAEFERLSDFGMLRILGAGLNWEPIPEMDVIASFTDEEGAPTVQQIGDPAILSPNVRVFDFARGETVELTRIEGGNPALLADSRSVLKLGITAKPFSATDLSFTANYTATRIDRPIASFPTATPEIEAAFPDRFLRGEDGRLIQIDSRPVNFARADRQEIRWGINFSKRIGPEPPPGGWRGRGRSGGVGGEAGRGGDAQRPQRPEGGWSGPRGGGGGGFRGGRGGRMQLALYHNWRLQDEILIRPGVPVLDLLDGSAVGNNGGRPEHEIEAQAGYFRNGFGARLSANWQSGTFVRGGPAGAARGDEDLFFSDLATVNLRLFAELGRQRALVRNYPWLRGTRISLVVDNVFDQRLDVRTAAGTTPLGYQPAYLDPVGRAVRVSIRKLFF